MTLELHSPRAALERGSAIRACRGERVSGDAAVLRGIPGGCFAAIVDALGHGADAHALAAGVEAYLARRGGHDVVGLLQKLHARLRGSRGAAAGLCAVDAVRGRMVYAGIGNTVLRRFGASETRLVSRDGVVGQNMGTPRLETLDLAPGDTVLLYTDGVKDRFGLDDYRGILYHEAAEVARAVVERFGKPHDDAACIVLRYRP